MIKEPFEETLKCALTPSEVKERASRLAIIQREIEEEEDEKKATASNFANELKRLGLIRQSLARQVRDEATFRQVECIERINEQSEVERVRTDTGEIIKTRPATNDERQHSFLDDATPA